MNSRIPGTGKSHFDSSGTLGKYVMDHIFRTGAAGEIPGMTEYIEYGRRPTGVYIPRFRNVGGEEGVGFKRGYGYQGSASRSPAPPTGFGASMKEGMRNYGPWRFNMGAFGECLPYEHNKVSLHPDKVDRYGVPLMRFDVRFGDNEVRMMADAREQGEAMLAHYGAQASEARNRGRRGRVGFAVRIALDLARSVPAEHAHAHRLRRVARAARPDRRRAVPDSIAQDVRFALRSFGRAPGFTLVAAATLALGSGAFAGNYALADAVLFRPLAPRDPDRVRWISMTTRERPDVTGFIFSYADYRDIRDGARAFDTVTLTALTPFVLRAGDDGAEILGEIVSGTYFEVLGVAPGAGRLPGPRDDAAGAPPVAVISRRAAERHFAGRDPIGAGILLNGSPFTVVGVAPADFAGVFVGTRIDAWVPVEAAGPFLPRRWRTSRNDTPFNAIVRLAPGVTPPQGQAELDAIAARLAQAAPVARADTKLHLLEGDLLRGRRRQTLVMFAGLLALLGGLVLVIVCANVANLLLARGIGLRGEMAMRLALGAGRWRVFRQVFAESLAIAGLGAVGAIGVAAVMIRLLSRFEWLPTLSFEIGARLDLRVAAVAGALALAAGALLGISPALQATRPDVPAALKEFSTAVAGGRRLLRLRRALVAGQLAMSLLLMSAAGLFVRSLENARGLDLGFNPDRGLAIDVDLAAAGVELDESRRLFDELHRRLRSRGDVAAVAFSNRAPVDASTPAVDLLVDGAAPAPGGRAPQATMHWASPEYFEALEIPILSGRAFTAADREGAPRVAIVNDVLARRFWAGGDAIGRTLRPGAGAEPVTIVGVARTARYRTPGEAPQAHLYLPFAQVDGRSAAVIVTAQGDPRPLLPVVQRALEELPTPVQGFFGRTLRDHLSIYLIPSQLAATLAAVLGGLALLVAAIGLYGVIACMVQQQTREIAIRMALGAERARVRSLVMQGGIRVLVPGLLLGGAGALAVARLAGSFLYGVGAADPPTLAASALVLTTVVLAASYLPARRAMRVDPAIVLRR